MYLPQFEHDACGIGLIAQIKNEPSHSILSDALLMLENMEHRGGCGAEPETGDGAGVMTGVPHELFRDELAENNAELPELYGLGMLFLPKPFWEECLMQFNAIVKEHGFEIFYTRNVPVNNLFTGPSARETEPKIIQVFLKSEQANQKLLEKDLYILKKNSSHRLEQRFTQFYVASLSSKKIVYKGQLRTDQLRNYYLDLQNQSYKTSFAIIHSRFSTNTLPKWSLAQPFRYLAHNGEINTIRGNVNNMKSKEALMQSELFTREDLKKIYPICDHKFSDSANLDEVLELMVVSGRSIAKSIMTLIPEAWQYNKKMDENTSAFYKYSASIMEPWDGPAALCFTDGNEIGAALDRNGLRPCRYTVTFDDRFVVSSETGALPIEPKLVKENGHLRPGHMILVNLEQGILKYNDAVKKEVVDTHQYANWIKKHRIKLRTMPGPFTDPESLNPQQIKIAQTVHGQTVEELEKVLLPMGTMGKEPIGSMGLDIPMSAMSEKRQHISSYFKQIFAQVSNPPIDPIRERLVMSLFTRIGQGNNLLQEEAEHCHQVHITRPVLRPNTFQKVLELVNHGFQHRFIDIVFNKNQSLEQGIDALCMAAEKAVNEGVNILILTDKNVDESKMPIPSLMATGAVHQYLINKKLRAKTSLIVHAADVFEVHHYATLIGYGASGVAPYLTMDILQSHAAKNNLDFAELSDNYVQSVGKGLLKIMSKMGISTLQSYSGAQIFEALGIASNVVDKCFNGTISRIGGVDFNHFEKQIRASHSLAFSSKPELEHGGIYSWRQTQEKHSIDPKTVHLLQKATKLNSYELYKEYANRLTSKSESPINLRNLLQFKKRNPIPLKDVEPEKNILKRFATGAMSFGSISHEAHTTLAIAMNRIGGKSNSGEGGEDESRFKPLSNGDSMNSKIKQVASGRFGVTSYYLNNAEEIQIKIAQGAKPGEGGQLPGHKVDKWIAKVRMSTPSVDLISPPPHHDIYSIEDLAQLIFDLKNANPKARINVKLVAETGVGTIASGVAKAYADAILISGGNGGTGASPLSSIRHAGLPWEMGLAEAHQSLVLNKLRSRVVLQTDGKLMTGFDIAMATLLGAEEWGVSTAALIAEGCIMMRKCQHNTCPVGIATQDENLRKLFTGEPEHVVNLFKFMARELREIMADLGFRSINEMVGQSHVLEKSDYENPYGLNLERLLVFQNSNDTRYNSTKQQNLLLKTLDTKIWNSVKQEVENGEVALYDFDIKNTDRAVGAIISSHISRKYGSKGLDKSLVKIKFKGYAGQSFGAFLANGVKFMLEGSANDYVAKGLSGGRVIIHPPRTAKFHARENTIIGNVALYGATSGEVYINGIAGERFAVRNSGAVAVVEGVGDHGCEYMTGGTVFILGSVGKNFAAGMSGGIAYVLDLKDTLKENCNQEMVIFDTMTQNDVQVVRKLLINHLKNTGSSLAQEVLLDWTLYGYHIKKLIPTKYKSIIEQENAAIPMTPVY